MRVKRKDLWLQPPICISLKQPYVDPTGSLSVVWIPWAVPPPPGPGVTWLYGVTCNIVGIPGATAITLRAPPNVTLSQIQIPNGQTTTVGYATARGTRRAFLQAFYQGETWAAVYFTLPNP